MSLLYISIIASLPKTILSFSALKRESEGEEKVAGGGVVRDTAFYWRKQAIRTLEGSQTVPARPGKIGLGRR
jgi:hypothetical protein